MVARGREPLRPVFLLEGVAGGGADRLKGLGAYCHVWEGEGKADGGGAAVGSGETTRVRSAT